MERNVFLMRISNLSEYKTHLQQLREIYNMKSGRIFVLQNRFDDNEVFITFNTEYNWRVDGILKVNRKKDTNTLFTINALNLLSMQENGKIDKDWTPNWNEFMNCLLLSKDNQLNVIPTVLIDKIIFNSI
jgi:hypothetical protein